MVESDRILLALLATDEVHYLSYMIKPLAESGHHFPIGKVLICAYNGYDNNNVFMSI